MSILLESSEALLIIDNIIAHESLGKAKQCLLELESLLESLLESIVGIVAIIYRSIHSFI